MKIDQGSTHQNRLVLGQSGVCISDIKFFQFMMYLEINRFNSENPEKKAEAEGESAPPVDRSQKPNTVSGGQGGGMGYRVRDINEIPSMVCLNSLLVLYNLQLT